MNEDELKAIWQSEKETVLPNIDFEKFQKESLAVETKLKRKLKFEIIFSVILPFAILPLCYFIPKLVYFTPLIFLACVWYIMKVWKMYKRKTNSENFQSIKKTLEDQVSSLTDFIRWNRLILYPSVPFLVITSLLVQLTFAELLNSGGRVISLIIVLELFSVIICELYFRAVYFPIINKSNELIKELE